MNKKVTEVGIGILLVRLKMISLENSRLFAKLLSYLSLKVLFPCFVLYKFAISVNLQTILSCWILIVFGTLQIFFGFFLGFN
jgi:hypothetical protein